MNKSCRCARQMSSFGLTTNAGFRLKLWFCQNCLNTRLQALRQSAAVYAATANGNLASAITLALPDTEEASALARYLKSDRGAATLCQMLKNSGVTLQAPGSLFVSREK